ALKIGLEAGLRRITLESGCLKPINHLEAKIVEATSFGCIVNDILTLAKSCIDISFSHVRSGNQVAHCITKLSVSSGWRKSLLKLLIL
ncbi:Bromodomain adjacent to zinc finger domain protein 2B, partial [Bienertia sinuspersici]